MHSTAEPPDTYTSDFEKTREEASRDANASMQDENISMPI